MECKSLCGNIECNLCFNKSFAAYERSKYLYDKSLNPLIIFKSSHKKYDFYCNTCEHIFSAALNNVTCSGKWCPFCAVPSKKLCNNETCLNCFNRSFASNEKTKYWSTKNEISPRQVLKNSNKSFIFICDVCSHEFNVAPNSFINLKGCPFCAVPSQRLCDNIDCVSCFNRSFASVDKSLYWSTRNNIEPRNVLKFSDKKYLFKCNDCNHDFESSPSHISNGTWCPFCAKYSERLCEDENCLHCFNKSFASVEKSKCWDKKNKHQPREIMKYSNKKQWFKCDSCNHNFESYPSHISKGTWCPFCSIPTNKICDNQDCNHCFNRSFASHENAKYWSKKNILQPRNFIKNSYSKCWFSCQYCEYEYEVTLNSITSNNSRCILCINKTEKKLYNWLSSLYKNITIQKSFEWCIIKRKCFFDFVIEEKKLIIELDGEQHFKQVASWNTPEETQKRDIFKMNKANENGYSVIRVYQMDVYRDENNWKIKLEKAINTNYESPQNIYINNKDIYNIYIEKMNLIIKNQ